MGISIKRICHFHDWKFQKCQKQGKSFKQLKQFKKCGASILKCLILSLGRVPLPVSWLSPGSKRPQEAPTNPEAAQRQPQGPEDSQRQPGGSHKAQEAARVEQEADRRLGVFIKRICHLDSQRQPQEASSTTLPGDNINNLKMMV